MQKAAISYHPTKQIHKIYPPKEIEDYFSEDQLFVCHYPFAIVCVPKKTKKILQLIYFNLITARVLQQKIIPVAIHRDKRLNSMLIRQKNEFFILMITENDSLSLLSLKTHSIAFQYKLPDSKWIRFCYMNDQIITWTSESREVIFWHLFQQVPAGALKLPSLVREEHVQINNRNVLVLQTQLSKSFLLIDVTNR